jgi:hypothetical protein
VLDTLQNDVLCKGVPALSQSAKDAFAVGSTEAASRVLTAFARIYPQACLFPSPRAASYSCLRFALACRSAFSPCCEAHPVLCGLSRGAADKRRDCFGGADGR